MATQAKDRFAYAIEFDGFFKVANRANCKDNMDIRIKII